MQLDQATLNFIELLYRKEALLLFHYANAIFNNPSIAEEAVQETFIIVCMKYQSVKESSNPEGWIMNTHKNICRNIQRTRGYYLKKILSLDNNVNLSPYVETAYDVEDDLSTFVTSDDFMTLKKIILDGYSYKDLAIELDITVEACKKRFQRAKKRFQKSFSQ